MSSRKCYYYRSSIGDQHACVSLVSRHSIRYEERRKKKTTFKGILKSLNLPGLRKLCFNAVRAVQQQI